jgi:translocation and assembly module TamB
MVLRWTKRIAVFLAVIVLLIISLLLFLHTPWGKTIVRNEIHKYLVNTLKTPVGIGKIDYRLPAWIQIKDLLVMDKKKDTLLYGGNVYARIDMLRLLRSTLDIDVLQLDDILVNVSRKSNDFNFQFITDAFAAPDSGVTNATSKAPAALRLKVGQVFLNGIRFTFSDTREKVFYSFELGKLYCQADQLNLEKKIFQLHNLVTADGSITMIDSNKASVGPTANSEKAPYDPPSIFFALEKLGIKNLQFVYKKPLDRFDLNVFVDTMQLDRSSIDLKKQVITGTKFLLQNSRINFNTWISESGPSKQHKMAQSEASLAWKARLDLIDMRNNLIVYHNNAAKPFEGLDYNHLEIEKFSFFSRQNQIEGSNFISEVDSCSFIANKKFNLRGFRTKASYIDSTILINNLEIGLNQSTLSTTGDLVWQLKGGEKFRKTKTNCRIQSSSIAFADLLLIQPGIKHLVPADFSKSDKMVFSGDLDGSLNDFSLNRLRIKTRHFDFSGNTRLNLERATYSLVIDRVKIQKNILSPAFLLGLGKQNIYLPENIDASGQINGTQNKVIADLTLNSNYGTVHLIGDAGNFKQSENLRYNLHLDAVELETGKWIGMDSILGRISGQIVVNGSGINPTKMNSSAGLKIKSVVLNGYEYSNVDIMASMAESGFTAIGNSGDSNLVANFDLQGSISAKYPSIKGNVNLYKMDLKALGFTKDSVTVTTRLDINATTTDSQKLHASIFADSNILVINGKSTRSDNIRISANSSLDNFGLSIESSMLAAKLNTNYPSDLLVDEIRNIVKRINPLTDSVTAISPDNHITTFNATLNKNELISILVPGLEISEPIVVEAKYNASEPDSFFSFNTKAPSFSFKNIRFDQLEISANNRDDTIQITATGNSIPSNDTVYQSSVFGYWQNNMIVFSGLIKNSEGNTNYSIKTAIRTGIENTTIKLLEDPTLRYRRWEISPDNMILISNDGYIFRSFGLVNNGHRLLIESNDPERISPIEIRVDSFEIGDILALASFNDTTLPKGSLSASITVQQPIEKFPEFTGELRIQSLGIKEMPVGDLELQSRSVSEKLELSGSVKGNTELMFSGNINPAKGSLDLKAGVQKLDLKLIREFMSDLIPVASGNITADFRFTGSTDDPELTGFVKFDSAIFALTELNTPYHINGQKVEISYPDINFNNFTLLDTLENKLIVDGKVKMIGFTEYGLDLNAKTKNFIVLNSSRYSERVLYGKAVLDIDLNIKGTSNEPVIKGTAFLKDESSVHYILSHSKSDYTTTGKGMIHFVDLDTLPSLEDEIIKIRQDTTSVRKSFKGLKYNINFRVAKNAEFNILIDPATGDELVLKGEANLNTGIAENGAMGIAGTYQLNSGYYNMQNKFLKGKFLLVEGSTITFNGDPEDAEANVTTEYKIDASPAGLLRPAEEEAYNMSKRLPFVIVLTIKGPISSPELAFDIKLKEGAPGINNSLKSDVNEQLIILRNDVAAMNKQVFSLLVMNQFTVHNSGDIASSDLSPDVALKQGMSQFLAEGMNSIASGLIKGVDINVNMESYKTADSRSRTDIGFEVSKDMLDDRLTVTVGKNFITGDIADESKNSANQYIPDITTAYKLSRDGRYQLKAYRTNEYDAVVEGYFTETGVAFSIQFEYNLFKQIFQSQKKLEKE